MVILKKVFSENGSKNGTYALKNINILCVTKRGAKSIERKKIRITYQFKVTTLKMEVVSVRTRAPQLQENKEEEVRRERK